MSDVPTTYKAYTYASRGVSEEVLEITEVKTPTLPAQRVRIKVHSASLNLTEFKFIEYPGVDVWFTGSTPSKEQPHRLGFDVAGTVVQVGPGVHPSRVKVGDEVFGFTNYIDRGTLAEYADLDQAFIALKPKTLDFDHAASVPVVATTSYQALFNYTKLGKAAGQHVLILGGSTATGMYAIQFAKRTGAHVVVTGSKKNEELLKSLGADEVIDYRSNNWRDVIPKHSIDIAYDCGVEPTAWNDGLQEVLKKEIGEFVTLGPPTEPIESKYGATLHGFILVYSNTNHLEIIAKQIDDGKLKVVVDSVVNFDKVIDGVKRVKSQRAVGKVVVNVV